MILKLVLIIVIVIIIKNYETIYLNRIVLLTLLRGIITQNCFWWGINDLFEDTNGALLFRRLKDRGKVIPMNILGKEIYILTRIEDIKKLLDLSPSVFGVGSMKKNFFKDLMPKNVGVSEGREWVIRREVNEIVLNSERKHSYLKYFTKYIDKHLENQPKSFEEFKILGRKITHQIIFGIEEVYNPIYEIFDESNNISSFILNKSSVSKETREKYNEYVLRELRNPRENSLLYLSKKYHKNIEESELLDQVAHWIFPIVGIFSVGLPRLLVLLLNNSEYLESINEGNNLRNSILELFRLNNPVNSTFRKLLKDIKLGDKELKKGEEVVFFNNALLRDNELFNEADKFIPERWDYISESDSRVLMFNQGSQRCPGKELSIDLLGYSVIKYLELYKENLKTNIKLRENIKQTINPCKIRFEN